MVLDKYKRADNLLCRISHCDQCGDDIYNYKLEIY